MLKLGLKVPCVGVKLGFVLPCVGAGCCALGGGVRVGVTDRALGSLGVVPIGVGSGRWSPSLGVVSIGVVRDGIQSPPATVPV